jgi:predicted nucleic acid-binding Zn ribbon protein
MPIFEFACRACQTATERYLPHWDDPAPACFVCGDPMEKVPARFASPFSGSLRKYADPKREGAEREGYWAYRTRSSASGQPEPVWLDSVQAVREFNRAEGLAPPGEVPTHATISSDGRRLVSNGMPGQWASGVPEMPARLREMVEIPASQCRAPAATAAPAMPADFGVRPEITVAPVEVEG